MARFRGERDAFGRPGIEPRWTQGGKEGVGTAYSADSRVWFTIWNGCVTEVYYPTIDTPQVRDLQFLVTDGQALFHEEKRHLKSQTVRSSPHALAYQIINADPDERYRIVKNILAAPHLHGGGWGNNAYVMDVAGRQILTAERQGTWLALAASVPFARLSCGYVGASDGWTDLSRHFQMTWDFDRALDGNIALTGELALGGRREFTVAMAFGDGLHHAVTALLQALGVPIDHHQKRYIEQWDRPCRKIIPLEPFSGDQGNLYHGSYSLLLSHEDKTFPGAFIASLSIPWGESKGDEDLGGYHLVWTRDMVNSAMGLLAAGNTGTPLRALIYLAATQHQDGGFSQNFWIDGEPYWRGIQLDEVSFPILLAWRLRQDEGLEEFDPYSMVLRAASYLIRHGPATQQERWEEAGGYSPSTLAANIAALCCAAAFARERGDSATATYLEEYADFLECHVEAWTVTTQGTLHPDITRHFIRIHPVSVHDRQPDEDPNHGTLAIANRAPGARREFPAKDIVDAGFLELVRYGIRKPDDPLVVDSLRVVDKELKVDTPAGPCWRRYNHDGYGQHDDGGPYQGWGRGRAWPLLTGERAHYELAAGRDVGSLVRALEGFASPTGLLPEQIWDHADRPDLHVSLGKPTGAAMPLMWAHAEYIKLLRSIRDRKVFDQIPNVAKRYRAARRKCRALEIWKPNRQPRTVRRGHTLRIQAPAAFRLHWTRDEWQDVTDTTSSPTALGIEFVDIHVSSSQQAPIRFTFFWTRANRWEG
ncbi:MAG: glucan 1,4-alpha-glucosidase, partial [Acidobacteria bacterium]|nr:glucan 1,4-alpha-glucosidase [Acidobacteriota bacterium]